MMRFGLCLLLLAGCTQTPDPRGVRADEVLLQVSATGRADSRPDEARVSVGVSTNAPTAGAAATGNSAAMNRVTAAIGRLGVPPDDIQTRNVSLGRVDYGPGRGGYRAENLIEVRIRDLDKAGPLIAAATEAGGNLVSGPDLRTADPERAANAAYASAYRAARARAEAYAGAAGLKVARVLAIRDGGSGGGPPPPVYGRATNEMALQTAAPPIHAGTDTHQVQISVDFALGR